jgi:hypothetical protein
MKKAIFTSILPNYLPKAMILGDSIAQSAGDDIDYYIVISEKFAPRDCLIGWKVLYIEDILEEQLMPWAMMHDVVELCTAIKPYAMGKLLKKYDSVLYIDPDIKVYNKLEKIFKDLEEYDCILSPHLCSYSNEKNSILDHEISILKHGIYNLGFLGLSTRPVGREINEFWKARCHYFCERNSSRGVFTDQKFFDLVPFYFDKVKVDKNPGYDVASWNLFERKISMSENGELLANGVPLVFYHFSSFDSGDGITMTTIHGRNSPILLEIWTHYIRLHKKIEFSIKKEERTNSFNVRYKDLLIDDSHRKTLREILIEKGQISFDDFDQVIRA